MIINRFHVPTISLKILKENLNFKSQTLERPFRTPRVQKANYPFKSKWGYSIAPIRLIIKPVHRLPYKSSNRKISFKEIKRSAEGQSKPGEEVKKSGDYAAKEGPRPQCPPLRTRRDDAADGTEQRWWWWSWSRRRGT